MRRLHLARRIALPIALLAGAACGGDDLLLPTDGSPGAPSTTPPAQLEMVQGNQQSGLVATPLSKPLIVRVFNKDGDGMPGQTVTWVVTSGEGTATPASSTTNAQGMAQTAWTLGVAGPNSIDAVVAGVGSVTFSATANAGGTGGDNGGGTGTGGGGGSGGGTVGTVPSAVTSTISVDPASIQAGNGVSTVRVTVRDQAGLPVPGAVVTITASGSGNHVTQPSGPTGADGVAVGTLTSTVAGTKDIMASVNGSVQIGQTVQVSVTAAPADRVRAVDGNNQRARAGQSVAVPPAVRVTDAAGRPVAGYGVTFVVTQGGGTVAGASQVTNSDGIARVGGWTLGAGRNTLEARAGSLRGSPVVFEATGTEASPPPPPPPPPPPHPAAQPDHFVFTVQPHDVRLKEWFRVQVAIVDANGNVVPLNGTQVYLGLFPAGADHPNNDELAGDRFVDTKNGVATFDLFVTDTGSWRFLARSDYLPKNLGPYGPEKFSNVFQVR